MGYFTHTMAGKLDLLLQYSEKPARKWPLELPTPFTNIQKTENADQTNLTLITN
jgi:hypothetical protein